MSERENKRGTGRTTHALRNAVIAARGISGPVAFVCANSNSAKACRRMAEDLVRESGGEWPRNLEFQTPGDRQRGMDVSIYDHYTVESQVREMILAMSVSSRDYSSAHTRAVALLRSAVDEVTGGGSGTV